MRRLTLAREALAELTTEDLADVVGAADAVAYLTTLTGTRRTCEDVAARGDALLPTLSPTRRTCL